MLLALVCGGEPGEEARFGYLGGQTKMFLFFFNFIRRLLNNNPFQGLMKDSLANISSLVTL